MIRVMIVATYNEVREGLCVVLGLAGGMLVTNAVNGLNSAIHQAETACPDVAVIDMEMPDDEGYEILRQFRRRYPAIKLIALTARDYPAARTSALRLGAHAVMVKGLGVAEMAAIIQSVVGVKETHPGRSNGE